MGALIRFMLLVVVSAAVSLALVLLITSRSLDLNEASINAAWLFMVAQKTPVAVLAQDIWGLAPPYWARQVCVLWQKAQPMQFWWLPIVIIALRYVLGGFARKKTRR